MFCRKKLKNIGQNDLLGVDVRCPRCHATYLFLTCNIAGTPLVNQHSYAASVPSSLGKDSSVRPKFSLPYLINSFTQVPSFNSRSASVERRFRRPLVRNPTVAGYPVGSECFFKEPLTPETSRRPLSPTDSLAPPEMRWTSFGQPRPHISDIEDTFVSNDNESLSPQKPKSHRTLRLLTRSRGVQTDGWLSTPVVVPSLFHPSVSPSQDHRSDSSSFSDTTSSNLSGILERIGTLFHRMVQADALTLTNRLKRQHLKGADIGHLSRVTVKNIISELTALHTQHRHLLEDEILVTSCRRKDFRLLFKLFKDIFNAFAELRVVLNDVILDPSIALKVSELALHPSKAEGEGRDKERELLFNGSLAPGWMAPISKLFLPNAQTAEQPGPSRSLSSQTPRFVPKLGPALSASATTVNVEFSGTAVGRSTTSIVAKTKNSLEIPNTSPSAPSQGPSSSVMHIFAGASRSSSRDPWVVVPKGPRSVSSSVEQNPAYSTTSTSTGRIEAPTLFRNIEAVLDLPSPTHLYEDLDILGPLPHHPLRRRGLSDSSIHSTFNSQATDESQPSDSSGVSVWPDRQAVLRTFSRTVQNLRMTASGALSLTAGSGAATSSTKNLSQQEQAREALPERSLTNKNERSSSPAGLRSLLPTLSSWAAGGNLLDPVVHAANAALGGSVDDEAFIPHTRRLSETHGHDFF